MLTKGEEKMHKQRNFWKVSLAWVLGFIVTLLSVPGVVLALDLLDNGAFETFQSYNGEDWRGFPERYGDGWALKVISEDGLHIMDSDTFGQFVALYYGVPYLNYRLEGNYSQILTSRRGWNVVFSQTVTVNNGQDYAFGGKIVTFWKGPDNEWDDTKILKRIGIDPTGGTSYDGASVVWTDWDGTDNTWTSPALAATAQTNQMTAFIQVNNIGGDVGAAYLNSSHIDNFKFELAPVANLNLPSQAAPGNVNVTWSVTVPDTGPSWELWGYDVEYKDSDTGIWQTIQHHDGTDGRNASYVLNAQAGKTYTFRVRPWQQKSGGGDPTVTALPGVWKEKSVIIGQAIAGQVINHAGLGLSGVTVTISGTTISTVSGNGGNYALATGADGTFYVQANDFNGLSAPPAAPATTTADTVGELTITLRPPDDVISNYGFGAGLSDWDVTAGASVSSTEGHSGDDSLVLTSGATASQTSTATDMRSPLLSFWHKSDGDASLTVEILGPSGPIQTKLVNSTGKWSHLTLESGLDDSYSGTIGVQFSHATGANILIDEVTIASGPHKTFLPLTLKN
jgi:hypothetical protein